MPPPENCNSRAVGSALSGVSDIAAVNMLWKSAGNVIGSGRYVDLAKSEYGVFRIEQTYDKTDT